MILFFLSDKATAAEYKKDSSILKESGILGESD